MGCSAPASMPESEALTMQRTPATRPMPAITPPPGTLCARSSLSCPSPASEASGRKGAPVSSSSASRSRGSSWPRRAKRSAEAFDAAAARASCARTCPSSASMPARWAWKDSLAAFSRDSMAGMEESVQIAFALHRL